MQEEGYFASHPHYSSSSIEALSDGDQDLDWQVCELEFSEEVVVFPVPYSDSLERSVKRTESVWLPKMFDLPQSGAALDVGCGYGRSIKWLRNIYDEVVGVDISETAINSAAEFLEDLSNVSLYVSNGSSLPAHLPRNHFDFTYAFTVFQHIPREFTLKILSDVNKVLKPGGKVVFNMISGLNEHKNDGDMGVEWAIGYSEQAVKELLKKSRLSLVKTYKWTATGLPVSWLWVLAEKP